MTPRPCVAGGEARRGAWVGGLAELSRFRTLGMVGADQPVYYPDHYPPLREQFQSLYEPIERRYIEALTGFIYGRRPLEDSDRFVRKMEGMSIGDCAGIPQPCLQRVSDRAAWR